MEFCISYRLNSIVFIMKKIILCLSLIAISLSSCSSDSDSNDSSSDILVKKVVYTSITDNYTETIDYTYNGNKIVKGVYDDGSQDIFTYTGNLITKIEMISAGEIIYLETFTYDSNGRLVTYFADEDGFTYEETFVYNANGTVTNTIDGGGVRTLHFANDELVQIVDMGGNIYDYTYDSKNSPFRNVTGYDKIAMVVHGDHEFFGAKQNISSIRETTGNVAYMTNTMTYNANNYPLTVNSAAIFEFGTTSNATVQYTY